jgi:acyl transferase domain-containing protein
MSETEETMPIAIVGLGCRLPGGASSPEKLWDLLIRKQSARKETPPERFNIDAFYHPDGDKNGTVSNTINEDRWLKCHKCVVKLTLSY